MDWTRVDFDWNQVRAFLVTADEGSYSAAGRALRVAQPTIGRQVAALEQALSVNLFERAGRGLKLTPTGLKLVEHVRHMSDAAVQVSRVAAGESTAIEGPLCICASELVASALLPPVLAKLHASYPGLELEVIASNTAQDLRTREADLAVRNFQPTEPELVARKLGDRVAYLYASKKYLRTLGARITRATLARATFIGFDHSDTFRKGLEAALGLSLEKARFPFLSASQHVQWALVRAGAGVGIMLSEVGDADPSVGRVMRELPGIPIPMWLVSHQDVRTSRRLRVVADLLAEALGASSSAARRDAAT
jgi:DNA-binding transcriptional LysR family regulator